MQILQEVIVALALRRGTKIRILVPTDNEIRNEMVEKLRKFGINIRDNKKPLPTKLTNLVVDNALSLTVELKDDMTKRRNEEGIGLAPYSNSEPTISSYVSIFEILWMQNEM